MKQGQQAVRILRKILYYITELVTFLGLVETILTLFAGFITTVKDTVHPDRPINDA